MGMKVFDLSCSLGHRFEGWFGSEADFLGQRERRLLTCPMCDDAAVERVPSAARLNVSHLAEPQSSAQAGSSPDAAAAGRNSSGTPHGKAESAGKPGEQIQTAGVDLQAMWLQAVRHVMANTEDVGDGFAAEARDIHHGRSERRGIRGQTTPQEAAELREEGIEIHSIAVPAALRGPVQ